MILIKKYKGKIMLCKNDCGFHALSKQNGYCSKCFLLQKNADQTEDKTADTTTNKTTGNQTIEPSKERSHRCEMCHKKLKTNIVFCKCGHAYCPLHIYHKNHDCTFDFKLHGRAILEKNNPKIQNSQL